MSKTKALFAKNFFGAVDLNDLLKKDEVIALQKVAKGRANEYEQQLAYLTIINKLCRSAAPSFNESHAITSFNEGVRHVGALLSIAAVSNIDTFKENNPINNKTK